MARRQTSGGPPSAVVAPVGAIYPPSQDAECGHRRGPVVDFWGLCCRCVVRPRRRPPAAGRSGPSASFLGSDMRAAYYGGTGLTGAGQNLGLLEYAGTDL